MTSFFSYGDNGPLTSVPLGDPDYARSTSSRKVVQMFTRNLYKKVIVPVHQAKKNC